MSVSYHDYHDKYYPPHLEMMNNGKLSLVAPMFIDFGMKLLAKIRELINESKVWKKGRYALNEAYSLLVNDEILLALYIHSYNDSQDNIEFYSMVYKKYIVTKTHYTHDQVLSPNILKNLTQVDMQTKHQMKHSELHFVFKTKENVKGRTND